MTKNFLLLIIVSLTLMFSGCSFVKKKTGASQNIGPIEGGVGTVRPDQTEQQLPVSETPIDDQLSVKEIERLTLPSYVKQSEKPFPELEAINPEELVLEKAPVMINVEGMPLSDFITYAIGNTLKATYFIDEGVRGMKTPVTLRMAKKVSAETAFEIVIDILRQHSIVVEQRGGSLHVLKPKPKQGPSLNIRVGRDVPETRAQITQLVSLVHVRIGNVTHLTRKLAKKDVTIKEIVSENAYLLAGPATSVKEIVSFIEMFDVPYFHEKMLFMMPLTYWQPDDFIKQITTILENIGFIISKRPKTPGIAFIPIIALDSVLVILPDDKTMQVVMEWKERLDTPESAGTKEKPFTYTPRYTKATELVDAIKNLYGVGVVSSAKGKTSGSKGKTPKTSGASYLESGLKIGADDRRNLVVLMTTPSKYKTILSLFQKLDTPPRQVLIEATVAEVTLKDDLQYGLEWFLKNNYDGGPFSVQSLGGLGSIGSAGMAFSYTSDRGNFGTILSALANEDKIKILSRPKLMVLDNEQASINIGTDVPVITSEIPDDTVDAEGGSTNILRNIQYRSTGLILDVTPTINTEGLVTLAISISLDEAQSNSFGSIDNPMILTRSIKTIVAVSNGQSIILGGLMRENKSDTVSKIPFLGDIPILGNLFKITSSSIDKTELIITITPTIITTSDSATRVTNEIKKALTWLE